jgi:antitoxin ParD1/3/4
MKQTSMNISLPADLRELVDEKLQRDRYSSASEYVRELIREDMKREARERVDVLLLKSLGSKKRKVTPGWKKEKEALISRNSRTNRQRSRS